VNGWGKITARLSQELMARLPDLSRILAYRPVFVKRQDVRAVPPATGALRRGARTARRGPSKKFALPGLGSVLRRIETHEKEIGRTKTEIDRVGLRDALHSQEVRRIFTVRLGIENGNS
jgi:hypothetical protein